MTQTVAPDDEQVSIPLRTVVNAGQLAVGVVRESLRPGALELPVRWAHVCELLDPAPYLLGDELLLTSGVNLPSVPAEVDRYVLRLRAAGITALGFGVTPPMHEELPESLRAACARHGLPLLVVPERVPFLAVSRAVSVALEEAGRREQRRIVEAREALTSAAADGLDEVIAVLGRRLAGWACLVDGSAGGAVVDTAVVGTAVVGTAGVGTAGVGTAVVDGAAEGGQSEGGDTGGAVLAGYRVPRPLPAEATELLVRTGAGSGLRSASTQLADGTYLLAQPVYPRAASSPLVIAGRRDRFGLAERAILGVGAALLGLVGGAGSDAARLGGAATGLLLGGADPGQVAAGLLGPGEYRVLAGVAYRRGPGRAAAGYHWLRARLDTPLVEVTDGPRFTAVARGTVGLAQLDGLRADGWLVVAGSPVPAARLAEAVSEVDSLLQRAVALQRPVLARSAGLAAMVGPAAGADFAARLLAPLRELERDRPGEPLVETLRTWLANHGGWDRTAAALGVHRNSVRHRIARVERRLGVDLADPETRMELWFALRWSR
jgi:PucR-like helix-turn-helix protein/purine catabolism regulatory family protein